ncbi:AAA family ATPase [Streptomyces sp. ZAF1911]|uniref:AAA family ATPase n=1 Tax=Streptomyces sp. ZAF1911 TaxID=2944129 RepID=UPI003FCF25BF
MSPRDLFERESELTVLSRALKAAGSGSGGFTVVTGSAGMGRSRLPASVRETARTHGQRVLSARGSERERDFAFGVVRQLFEAMPADADAGERAALLAGPAAQAAEVFTGFGSSAGDFAVLHGLYWLTANGCESESLVLLVDDLQWCDTPSLRFLAHLLRQITADPAVTLVRPAALSRAATAALLARALDGSVDPAFATACHRATGGNPLLLRELTRTRLPLWSRTGWPGCPGRASSWPVPSRFSATAPGSARPPNRPTRNSWTRPRPPRASSNWRSCTPRAPR